MAMAAPDNREKWIVLLITSIGALMGPLDSTIVSVSLPTITSDLGMRPRIEELVDRQLYWEESGASRRLASSIQAFKRGRGGVFFTVMGGKVAEGLDFPGQELDIAVIVGLPYPPPSLLLDELKQRYDRKYGPGRGWEYASAVPAVRKVQQAVGRLIRTETDRGVAIILDNRMARYRGQLEAKPTKDPVAEMTGFLGWSKRF